MIQIPNTKVGSTFKNTLLDLTHDVNTTSDFGFVQPTLFQEILAKSHVTLSTKKFCRLGVLQVPSYANIKAKSYVSFIPMKQVFEAYDNMQSKMPYKTSVSNSMAFPASTDYLSAGALLGLAFSCGWYGPLHQITWDGLLRSQYAFVPVQWNIQSDGTIKPVTAVSENVNYPTFLKGGMFSASDNVSWRTALAYGGKIASAPVESNDYSEMHYIHRMPQPSLENADFVFIEGETTFFTFHATYIGRNILKIFNCLQISFSSSDKAIPLTALFAYYKGWYDIFNPGRETNFYETDCYHLIHRYYDYPLKPFHEFEEDETGGGLNYIDIFLNFLWSIGNCYYSLKPDYFTVCQDSILQGNNTNEISPFNPSGSVISYGDTSKYYNEDINWSDNHYPQIQLSKDLPILSSIGLKALTRLLPYVNRDSVIGRKIEDFMRIHYGESMPESTCLSRSEFDLEIDPVFSTNESESVSLGEYAGRGVGTGGSNTLKRDFAHAGFLLEYTVIVPISGYSQCSGNSLHVFKDDFYDQKYDSLGMEAVPQSEIFGDYKVFSSRHQLSEKTFGFRPRFMGYKYKSNVRSGDFNRLGYSSQLMPYCLDRYFTPPTYNYSQTKANISYSPGVSEVVSEELRYIGNNPNYGNFNRIFTENGGLYDDFIFHIRHFFKVSAPVLPIEESFNTYDPETSETVKDVEHA